MNLREMIEQGEQRTGSLTELAKQIGLHRVALQHAKAGKQALPVICRGKLAEIIGLDHWTVTAAAEAFREKDEKKKAYFEGFLRNAAVIATFALFVTLEVTPTPANAAPFLKYDGGTMYIM